MLAEGAGILVIEAMQHAQARGARSSPSSRGIATTSDGTDMVDTDMVGASETMRLALADAQLAPTDIDYVNAHGTGIASSDRFETEAIKRTFGTHSPALSVSSTKSMYGHPLGASGGIEAVACIKAMQEGWVPPTLGLDGPTRSATSTTTANVGRRKR